METKFSTNVRKTFDLDDDDARLLDTYTFSDLNAQVDGDGGSVPILHSIVGGGKGSNTDAEAFLDALERAESTRRRLARKLRDPSRFRPTSAPIGTASAARMAAALTSRTRSAHGRLYEFLVHRLGLLEAQTGGAGTGEAPTSSSDAAAFREQSRLRSLLATEDIDDHSSGAFAGDRMDAVLSSPVLHRALGLLSAVPAHRRHVLELAARARRAGATRRFLIALTGAGSSVGAVGSNIGDFGGGGQPMEAKAHDPPGYAGDMLAHSFRCLSVECDIAVGLASAGMRDKNGIDMALEGHEVGSDSDDNSFDRCIDEKDNVGGESGNDSTSMQESNSRTMTARDIFDDAVGGLSRPLRSRLVQRTFFSSLFAFSTVY